MVTIPIAIIVQWCGMTTAAARNIIIAEMIIPPQGLKHLNGETSEEMLGTFRDYACRDAIKWKDHIHQSLAKEVDIPHVLDEGQDSS